MKTLLDLLNEIDGFSENENFLNYLEDDKWVSITKSEFILKVQYLTFALIDMGITKGTTCAIISKSSPWWIIVNFAINLAGGISIPIFSNIASKNLIYELKDSDVKYAFISSNDNLSHINKISFKGIISHDTQIENAISLSDMFIKGKKLFSKDIWDKIEINEDDLYSIVYTSGSTGKPKGVEITQKNIISQIIDAREIVSFKEKEKALSLLPVAHIFENMLVNFYLSNNVSVYFADDILKVKQLLLDVQPDYMSVVPRLMQKIFSKVQSNVDEVSFIKKIIGNLAIKRALEKDTKSRVLWIDDLFYKLVYQKIRDLFGDNMKMIISGGAKLPKELSNFFINARIPVREGYGLTECSPVICANSLINYKSGTCGKVFNSLEVKLSNDKELLVKGASVMKRYHNKQEETDKTIIDGWLHTGDLASIDDDGFITITGRKKELFKTSTGNYVRPVKIESLLAKSIFINYSAIIANNRPYTVALLFIEDDTIKDDVFNKIIKKTNKKLDKHEKIQYFKIIHYTPQIEEGELTPSMKINRICIEDKYKDMIDSMY